MTYRKARFDRKPVAPGKGIIAAWTIRENTGRKRAARCVVLSRQSGLLEKIADVPFLLLRRCRECNSYCEVGQREAHVITLEETRKAFPDTFPNI